jgi:RecA/RadA recombinase
MANITNRPHKNEVDRIFTGCHSLDMAFEDNLGQHGIRTRAMFEICGNKGVGKSTFMFSLAGLVAKNLGNDITLVDFEGQNESTVDTCLDLSGFTGEVDWKTYAWTEGKKSGKTTKGDMTSDEDMLAYTVNKFYENPPSVVMMDSLAAFTPNAMRENDVNAGNMGITAKPIKTFLRQALKPLIGNPKPTIFFFTNHQYPIIGGFRPGLNAPIPMENAGGKAVGFFTTQSVDMKKLFGYSYPEQHGYVLEGKVAKNRAGYGIESKISFFVYIQAGEGINKNLTSVIDCIMYGVAESSSKNLGESSTVTLDGQNMGKFRDLIAARHDPGVFLPFSNALKAVTSGIKEASTTIGSE